MFRKTLGILMLGLMVDQALGTPAREHWNFMQSSDQEKMDVYAICCHFRPSAVWNSNTLGHSF